MRLVDADKLHYVKVDIVNPNDGDSVKSSVVVFAKEIDKQSARFLLDNLMSDEPLIRVSKEELLERSLKDTSGILASGMAKVMMGKDWSKDDE